MPSGRAAKASLIAGDGHAAMKSFVNFPKLQDAIIRASSTYDSPNYWFLIMRMRSRYAALLRNGASSRSGSSPARPPTQWGVPAYPQPIWDNLLRVRIPSGMPGHRSSKCQCFRTDRAVSSRQFAAEVTIANQETRVIRSFLQNHPAKYWGQGSEVTLGAKMKENSSPLDGSSD